MADWNETIQSMNKADELMADKPWRNDKRRMVAVIERALRMLRTTSSRYYAEWEKAALEGKTDD